MLAKYSEKGGLVGGDPGTAREGVHTVHTVHTDVSHGNATRLRGATVANVGRYCNRLEESVAAAAPRVRY